MDRRLVQYHKKKLFMEQRFLFQNIALQFFSFLRQQPVPQKTQMRAELYSFCSRLSPKPKEKFSFSIIKIVKPVSKRLRIANRFQLFSVLISSDFSIHKADDMRVIISESDTQ